MEEFGADHGHVNLSPDFGSAFVKAEGEELFLEKLAAPGILFGDAAACLRVMLCP
jgi:hypothetical protein